jgi:hypothetical protein
LKSFFSQFAAQELAEWCRDSGLEVESQSKPKLIQCLISQKSEKKKHTPKKTAPKKGEKTAEIKGLGIVDIDLKKRPELKKGITAANVFNYYKR